MKTHMQSTLASILVAMLLFIPIASAQQPTTPAPMPANPESDVASRLAAAHTVYVQDLGTDPGFPAADGAAFTQFTADLQTWGRFQLAPSAATADFVLQFRTGMAATDAAKGSPYIKLTFADPKTAVPLWIVTVPVLTGTHKKVNLFDQSVGNAVSQVKLLDGDKLSKNEQSALLYAPGLPGAVSSPEGTPVSSHHVGGWVALGFLVAVGVGVPIAMHIASNNSLAKMKASQDAFCEANHIPLNECAGG